MAKRLYLRAGEVPALFGLDRNTSEWALHERLTSGEDNGSGDYGRWQGRLMVPIMHGICEDHSLKNEGALEPKDCTASGIMPSKAWRIGPKMETGGRSSIMVVTQRASTTMREWKEPSAIPAKAKCRYEAIAAAYDMDDVLIGVLIDGYSTQLYHLQVSAERRAEIRERCLAFIEDVKAGNEPDIDFGSDAASIRKGIAITRVEAASGQVEGLITERARLINEKIPADATLKRVEARIREIETNLIHLAGPAMRLETEKHIVGVERDNRQVPKVTVVDKAPTPLF